MKFNNPTVAYIITKIILHAYRWLAAGLIYLALAMLGYVLSFWAILFGVYGICVLGYISLQDVFADVRYAYRPVRQV